MAANSLIGIPANATDFEEKCVALFAALVGDPHFKRVATSGKNQQGIDLIGARDRDPHQPVAVQCKLKGKGGRLTETEVRSDLTRALAIRPALTEVYLVTTASGDLAYDALALTIRQEQVALGRRVDVQIWGFPDADLRGRVLSHAMNRRLAALKGFEFIRLTPTSRTANSSSAFSEEWAIDRHRAAGKVEANRRLGLFVQYADLTDLMLMLDLKLGGGVMEAVNGGQKLIRAGNRR